MVPPTQIRDDLRGLFRGGLHFGDAARAVSAADASPFHLTPLGVAAPLDAADLALFVKYAHEHRIPVAARGAGTGDAGESLTAGIVLDLGAHFRGGLDLTDNRLRVRAGEPLASVDRFLAAHGRRLGPDLGGQGRGVGTVGGALATDACGVNVFKHGYARDLVRALTVVWDTGDADGVNEPGFLAVAPGERGPRHIEVRARTAALLAEHRDLTQVARPQTRFTRCGYRLHDVLTPSGLNLTRLLVGSEGTLGVIADATLRTVPLAGGTARALLGFTALDGAVQAGLALLPLAGMVSCELLDQRRLAFAKAAQPKGGVLVPPPMIGAVLAVAAEADGPADALDALTAALDRLRRDYRFVALVEATTEPRDLDRVRDFADASRRGIETVRAGPRPTAGCDDVAVPVEELGTFLKGLQTVARRFDLAVPLRVNVLAGQVEARPILDARVPADRRTLWSFADAVHTLALSAGGTVGSRRGTGLLRSPWLEPQFGPLVGVFRAVKEIYDPLDLLNAGKLFDADPSRPAWPFPVQAELPTPRAPIALALFDDEAALTAEVEACHSCGACRTEVAGRMCPVFRATAAEAASPRAKANLWRAALQSADPLAAVGTPDAEEVARLCVNCKMCHVECPTRVDVPRLMLEAKAAHHDAHGFRRGAWIAARIEGLSMLAGTFAFTANALLATRPTRWLAEKLFGISKQRALPRFTHRTFLRRAWRLKLTGKRAPIRGTEARPDATVRKAEKVVYFVDLFANYHDPSLGLATVAVLRHHGIEVYVPWRQRGSGMAPLVQGDVETARRTAAANVRTLAPLVREGYRIVCSDPTAALALTQEYAHLLDAPDADLVRENTVELTSFLWGMHEAGELRTDFEPLALRLGHHVPCHVKALLADSGETPAGPRLLALIPGLSVQTIDVSCSGMAGTYGLRAENFAASLEAGKPMLDIVRSDAVVYGSTECGACRMQMQTAAGKRTLHPVQYLALAYGLMPELRTKLARPLGRLITDG